MWMSYTNKHYTWSYCSSGNSLVNWNTVCPWWNIVLTKRNPELRKPSHTHTHSFREQIYKAVKCWQDRTAALTASISTTLEILVLPAVITGRPTLQFYLQPAWLRFNTAHRSTLSQKWWFSTSSFFFKWGQFDSVITDEGRDSLRGQRTFIISS